MNVSKENGYGIKNQNPSMNFLRDRKRRILGRIYLIKAICNHRIWYSRCWVLLKKKKKSRNKRSVCGYWVVVIYLSLSDSVGCTRSSSIRVDTYIFQYFLYLEMKRKGNVRENTLRIWFSNLDLKHVFQSTICRWNHSIELCVSRL